MGQGQPQLPILFFLTCPQCWLFSIYQAVTHCSGDSLQYLEEVTLILRWWIKHKLSGVKDFHQTYILVSGAHNKRVNKRVYDKENIFYPLKKRVKKSSSIFALDSVQRWLKLYFFNVDSFTLVMCVNPLANPQGSHKAAWPFFHNKFLSYGYSSGNIEALCYIFKWNSLLKNPYIITFVIIQT